MSVNSNPSFYFTNQNATNVSELPLQNNNQKLGSFQSNQAVTDAFSKQENTEEKKGLSTGAKVAIGVGILATVAGGIYLVKSGKGEKVLDSIKKVFNKNKTNVQNETEKLVDNAAKTGEATITKAVKTFTNNEGKVIENVKIKNGKAILEDGSAFSGVFKGTSKNGNTIETVYENGYKKSVTLNNVLRREYSAYSDIPMNKVKMTKLYNKKGELVKESASSYYENGKIKQLFSNSNGGINSKQFSKEGKIISRAEIGDSILKPKNVKMYYEDGKTLKAVAETKQGQMTMKTYSRDGNLASVKELGQFNIQEGMPQELTVYTPENASGFKALTKYNKKGEAIGGYGMDSQAFDVFEDGYMQNGFSVAPARGKLKSIPNNINEYKANFTSYGCIHPDIDARGIVVASDGFFISEGDSIIKLTPTPEIKNTVYALTNNLKCAQDIGMGDSVTINRISSVLDAAKNSLK